MYKIQQYDAYNNMFDYYDKASTIQNAKALICNGTIYGLYKIIRVDEKGHYQTIGYYEVDQEKAKKIK